MRGILLVFRRKMYADEILTLRESSEPDRPVWLPHIDRFDLT